MSPEEQSAIWCVTPEEPWFLALLRKLDDHIEDAADIVCMPQTAQNPGLLAHSAGSLESLRTLREEIERTRAEAFQNKFRQADERHG
jgi:hypothetical protein